MSMYHLYSADLSGTTSLTLNNISPDMNVLFGIVYSRSVRVNAFSSVSFRFNGDSGSNYSNFGRRAQKNDGTIYITGTNETSTSSYYSLITGDSPTYPDPSYGHLAFYIFDYNKTDRYTTIRTESAAEWPNDVSRTDHSTTIWQNTTTVSSINIFDTLGEQFDSGSYLKLYGYGK